MSALVPVDDVLHAELRHGDRRIELAIDYDADEHAFVIALPDAGSVWLAAELTAELAPGSEP